jgi:hypothetical protein
VNKTFGQRRFLVNLKRETKKLLIKMAMKDFEDSRILLQALEKNRSSEAAKEKENAKL